MGSKIKYLITLIAVSLMASTGYSQVTPKPYAAYINSGSGWTPWVDGAGFGQLTFTPPAIALYCQLSAGAPWTPCQPTGSGPGSGTVTDVSSGNLTPLFSVSIANPTTTPAFTFSLTTQAANTVFGNFTGGSAGPTFSAAPVFSAASLTNFPTFNQSTTGNAATATNISTNGTANQVWGMNSGATAQGWQTVSGSGGSPCTTTANAFQFNNSGSFGCAHITDNGTIMAGTEPLTITANGAASQPAHSVTGTPFAGTTTNSFPLNFIEACPGTPVTGAAWLATGTAFGIHLCPSSSNLGFEILGGNTGLVPVVFIADNGNISSQGTVSTNGAIVSQSTVAGLNLQATSITGSTQCLHANTSGLVSGTGSDCNAAPSFSVITSGTNTTGLVIGSSGVLSFSGTGIINANEINAVQLSTLATGILKNTTSTGVPSIAVAADFPTLNQNTTGTAANLSGTPALPNGTTATTQTVGDNTTKIATDAFVLANAGGISGLTTGFLPKAASATSITNSLCDEGITTANTFTCGDTAGAAFTGSVSVASSSGIGGGDALTEGTAPTGATSVDDIWADSTAHRLKMINNNGTAVQIVASGADINTSDQVTVTHLASALPVLQGGTGTTTPALVAGTNVTITGTWPNQTINASGGSGITFPQTVSGTTTSGGLVYFSSATQISSSSAGTTNAPILFGGAGTAPGTGHATDNGTVWAFTEGVTISPSSTSQVSLIVNNPTSTSVDIADFETNGAKEFSFSNAGAFVAAASVSAGTAPTCPTGTAGVWCATTGTGFTPTASVGGMWPNSADNNYYYNVNSGTTQHLQQTQTIATAYTNATTGATSIAGLAFTVAASTTYNLHCWGLAKAVATGGLKLTVTGPTTPTNVSYSYHEEITLSAGVPTYNDFVGTGTSYPSGIGVAYATTTTDMPFDFWMQFSNGTTAGTLQLQGVSAAAVTTTVEVGATCTLQ